MRTIHVHEICSFRPAKSTSSIHDIELKISVFRASTPIWPRMTEISLNQDVALGVTVPSRHARGRAARIGPALDQILANHGYPPALERLLAEALVLTALLGSMLKDPNGQLTIQAQTELATADQFRDIIVAMRGDPYADKARLDAQIRVGADAGAGEVVVLKLSGPLSGHASSVVIPFLLPDIPVVAWWPDIAPEVPAEDPLGQLAMRRITDATNGVDPLSAIRYE